MRILGTAIYYIRYVIVFIVNLFFNSLAEKEKKEYGKSLDEICKNSVVLSVRQYGSNYVKVMGDNTCIIESNSVASVVKDICGKYGFKVVNAESIFMITEFDINGVLHLSKI